VTRNALLLAVALGALRDPCGTEASPVGINGACTRTKDCEEGLACVAGVCSLPDGGAPETGSEAGAAGAGDGSAAD
jgi:hypothetical protein